MKWLPVNKPIWLLSLALLVGLLAIFTWQFVQAPRLDMSKHQRQVKIGFVDLMSHRHETYTVDLQVLDDCILATFRKPGDDQFIIKGNLVEVKKRDGMFNYKFSPVLTSTDTKASMAWEYIETLIHTDLWLQPHTEGGKTLLIGQEGVIFPL